MPKTPVDGGLQSANRAVTCHKTHQWRVFKAFWCKGVILVKEALLQLFTH